MQKPKQELRVLPVTTPEKAVNQALSEIDNERTGIQHGLYTEYVPLNVGMGKYFRFNTVNLFAGLSGHGKSYLVNIINSSFLNKEVNKDLYFVPIILHFCLEMSAYNEILRSVSKDLGVSFNYLLSSEYDGEKEEYNTISEKEYQQVKEALEYYKKKSILFFEVSGNVLEILNTVRYYKAHYEAESKKNGITYKFVINIDHTLLIDKIDKEATIQLMADVGKVAIVLRKEIGAMVNLLGQLNNNIEDVRRLTTPALHYPQKSDIYAQGQLFNACDNVFVIHQPALLKIPNYGVQGIPTNNLIHLIKLKARHGHLGSVWFKNNLDKGKLDCVKLNDILKKASNIPIDDEPYFNVNHLPEEI